MCNFIFHNKKSLLYHKYSTLCSNCLLEVQHDYIQLRFTSTLRTSSSMVLKVRSCCNVCQTDLKFLSISCSYYHRQPTIYELVIYVITPAILFSFQDNIFVKAGSNQRNCSCHIKTPVVK